jgi:hypothetical protein
MRALSSHRQDAGKRTRGGTRYNRRALRERTHGPIWFAVAAASIAAVALALRLASLSSTLLADEVWVAELARRGGWHAHVSPIPPLFYELSRFWIWARGLSDAALREPAAVCGLLLCLVPLLAMRLPAGTRFLWLLLLAFSSPLLFYSARMKQYTLEAMVAALLIVLFLAAIEQKSSAAWLGFFALALVGVTTLYAPVFIVAAAALVTLFTVRPLFRIASCFTLTFGAFAAAYVLWLAPASTNHIDMGELVVPAERWASGPRPFFSDSAHWVGQAMNLTRFWWLVLPAAAVLWFLDSEEPALRKFAVTTIAIAPPLVMAAASAAHLYPYGEVRLMLVCFPALFLFVASGMRAAVRQTTGVGAIVVGLFCAAFLFNGLARDTYNETYMRVYDLRPLYDFVAANHHEGEPIHATASMEPSLRYEVPALSPSIVRWTPAPFAEAGWYLGRVGEVPAGSADCALVLHGMTAARVTLLPTALPSVPSAALADARSVPPATTTR